MKTKIIGISFGVLLIGAIVFIISTQDQKADPEIIKDQEKVTKLIPKKEEKVTSPQMKATVAVTEKSSSLGKMPDPSNKEEMEAFFNKAFIAWNDKVASLIVNDLKLDQEALDKYSKIRDDYYESQLSLFQVQTGHEPQGTENKEGQRRMASTMKNIKKNLEEEHGINLDTDELNPKADKEKIQSAIENALLKDSDQFLGDHLNKVKGVLGNEGFKKYQKIKDDFNNEITEEGSEPLFKI